MITSSESVYNTLSETADDSRKECEAQAPQSMYMTRGPKYINHSRGVFGRATGVNPLFKHGTVHRYHEDYNSILIRQA
jgi:hypothetical protein